MRLRKKQKTPSATASPNRLSTRKKMMELFGVKWIGFYGGSWSINHEPRHLPNPRTPPKKMGEAENGIDPFGTIIYILFVDGTVYDTPKKMVWMIHESPRYKNYVFGWYTSPKKSGSYKAARPPKTNELLVGGFSPTHLKNMLAKLDDLPK